MPQPQVGNAFFGEYARNQASFAGEQLAIFDTLQSLRLDVCDTHLFESATSHCIDQRLPFLSGQWWTASAIDKQNAARALLTHHLGDRPPVRQRIGVAAWPIHLHAQAGSVLRGSDQQRVGLLRIIGLQRIIGVHLAHPCFAERANCPMDHVAHL